MRVSHFILLVIFSLCVTAVFATLMREDLQEQLTLAL